MHHTTFILCRRRRDWRLWPSWYRLSDGSWQFQWLCFYAHRIRVD